MDDMTDAMFFKDIIDNILIADVSFDERIVFTTIEIYETFEIACIGQRIEIDDKVLWVLMYEMADEVGTDESRAAGNKDLLFGHGVKVKRIKGSTVVYISDLGSRISDCGLRILDHSSFPPFCHSAVLPFRHFDYFAQMEEVFDDFIGKFWTNDRVTELEQLATEHEWRFSPRERFAEQPTGLKSFNLFKGKRGKRITGVIHPASTIVHCESRIYDYIYYSDGGKKKTTVIEMTCSNIDLSTFSVKPKKGISNIFNFKSKKRASSSLDKFTTNYQMEAADPQVTEMQIPDSVFGLVSDCSGLSLEGDGNILLYYYNRKQIPAQDLLREHEKAVEILDRLLHDREKEFV